MIARLTWCVLAVAALLSFALVLYTADLSNPLLWLVALFFGGWAASPYVLLFLASVALPADVVRQGVILGVALAVAIFGLSVYYDGFFVPPLDAQNGLLFLFIPLWQALAVGVATLGLRLWSRRRREL